MIFSSCKFEPNEPTEEPSAKPTYMNTAYIGTYTKKEAHVNGQAEGIYTIYQQPETGALIFGDTVAKITNPSFLKASLDRRNLYAVSELGPGDG